MTEAVEVAALEPVLLTVFPLEPVNLVTEAEIPQPRSGIDGEDGWSVQVGRSATHIVTRQVRGDVVSAWVDIIALAELVGGSGPAGATMELRATATHLERRWTQAGTAPTAWVQVLALSTLKGEDAVLPDIEASAETVPYGQPATLETSIDPETGRLLFAAQIPAGRDATIASFSAQSVAAGQSASVESSGPAWARNITLLVPSGDKGDKGDQGAQGAAGMPNTDLVGEGMPNGVVTAAPGSIYRDTVTAGGLLGTNGASQWIKTSGTGNTGWTVLKGNTGWRDMDSEFRAIAAAHGLTYTVTGGWGTPKIRRVDELMQYNISVSVTGVSTSATPFGSIDWRPAFGANIAGFGAFPANDQIPASLTGSAGVIHWAVGIYIRFWSPGKVRIFGVFPVVNESWPTILPGIPA